MPTPKLCSGLVVRHRGDLKKIQRLGDGRSAIILHHPTLSYPYNIRPAWARLHVKHMRRWPSASCRTCWHRPKLDLHCIAMCQANHFKPHVKATKRGSKPQASCPAHQTFSPLNPVVGIKSVCTRVNKIFSKWTDHSQELLRKWLNETNKLLGSPTARRTLLCSSNLANVAQPLTFYNLLAALATPVCKNARTLTNTGSSHTHALVELFHFSQAH